MVVALELLCQLVQLQNPMASCDPSTLLADGKCWLCLSEQQARAILIQLGCELVAGGGTGEVCIFEVPITGPVAPPPPGCTAAFAYYPSDFPGTWVWNSGTSSWNVVNNPL